MCRGLGGAVSGTVAHAEALRTEVTSVPAPLDLCDEISYIDEGFDLLGFASSGTGTEARVDGSSTPTAEERARLDQGDDADGRIADRPIGRLQFRRRGSDVSSR
jgi:hypothetical protein